MVFKVECDRITFLIDILSINNYFMYFFYILTSSRDEANVMPYFKKRMAFNITYLK